MMEIEARLGRLEPLAPLALGLHGIIMLSFRGGELWQWIVVAGTALLGALAFIGGAGFSRLMIFRTGYTLVATWLLLLVTGGTGSFFLLWYFVLVSIYPLLLPARLALILPALVAILYLALIFFSPAAIPAIVVFARAFLLFFIGGLVYALGLNLKRYATERQKAEEEIRRHNRELTLLNQVIAASTALSGPEPQPVLNAICRELAQAFQIPHVATALVNEAEQTLTVAAEYLAEERLAMLNTTIPVASDPSFQYLLKHKAPLVLNDAPNDPFLAPVRDLMRQRDVRVMLVLPLTIQETVVGSLVLETPEARPFSVEEVNLAWSVADQLAGALARARLDEERRLLEAQYHQAQKMEAIGQLSAGIAHDFNNILTAINGFTELIQLKLPPDDPNQELLDQIMQASARATDLVRQLLAFSRKQVIEPRIVNLNDLIIKMEKILPRLIHQNIEVKTILAPNLWPIRVDPVQIEQVIVNLAVNARDAMPDGGRLTIETANVVLEQDYTSRHFGAQPGPHVLLAITDTGHGMSAEVQAHIFEPFFTTKEGGKGTGLGLATVFGIVKQSGGNIWVYSEEGIGTTFKIYLPRAQESAAEATVTEVKPELLSGHETILLAEDNGQVRDLIRRVLQNQGYTLLEAQNGREALDLAARHPGPIHLLLTDLIMPDLSGAVLAEQLAQIRPDIKILFMSGYNDDAIAHHGMLEPNIILLQKPFSPTTLAARVRAALDR